METARIILVSILLFSFITVLARVLFPSNLFWNKFDKSRLKYVIYCGAFIQIGVAFNSGFSSAFSFLDKPTAESISSLLGLISAISIMWIIISLQDHRNLNIMIRSKLLSDVIVKKYSDKKSDSQKKQIIEWYKKKLEKELSSNQFTYKEYVGRKIKAVCYFRVIDLLADDDYTDQILQYSKTIKDILDLNTDVKCSYVDVEEELMRERLIVK